MFNRIPPDSISGEDGVQRSAETDCGGDILEPVDPAQSSNRIHIPHQDIAHEADVDQGASVIQMAFIQMMTQKVIEATANHPDILDQLNSSIRTDKDLGSASSMSR